jgi:hypothetical protein
MPSKISMTVHFDTFLFEISIFLDKTTHKIENWGAVLGNKRCLRVLGAKNPKKIF